MTTTITGPQARAPGAVQGTSISCAVPAGETSPWQECSNESIVVCIPGAGGTMKAQATWSPPSVVRADNANGTSNANAVDWSFGTVSAATTEALLRATAVRFVATTAAGVGEVAR